MICLIGIWEALELELTVARSAVSVVDDCCATTATSLPGHRFRESSCVSAIYRANIVIHVTEEGFSRAERED